MKEKFKQKVLVLLDFTKRNKNKVFKELIEIIFIVSMLLLLFVVKSDNIKLSKENKEKETFRKMNEILYEENNKLFKENLKLVEEKSVLELEIKSFKDNESYNMLSLIEPIKEKDKMLYFTLYKQIVEKFDLEVKTIYDEFNSKQIRYMQKCIETETYTCDFINKVNVASVILNRVYSDIYSNDPIEVVTQKSQFAYGRDKISETTILALEYAYMFGDTTDGSIGFNSFDSYSKEWNGLEYVFTDEVGHHFYKKSGATSYYVGSTKEVK